MRVENKHFIVQPLQTQSLLKQMKIKKAAPTCFGLQGNHHQGASQCLAKITHWFMRINRGRTGSVSVMAA